MRIKGACTHFETWVKKGTVRVKCLAQEHNDVMSLARARTRTARSRVERTSHEATTPLTSLTAGVSLNSPKDKVLNHFGLESLVFVVSGLKCQSHR